MVLKSLDRIDRMIRSLLDAEKLEAGGSLQFEHFDCDLAEVLGNLREELEEAYPGRFRFLGVDLCVGQWNPDGLKRVIENLTLNALKYGDPKRPIEVELAADLESATISVRNFGRPIPARDQRRLFDFFWQAQSPSPQSWGIGLSAVKGIVQAHSGRVEVRSTAAGGTVFKVILPRRIFEAQTA